MAAGFNSKSDIVISASIMCADLLNLEKEYFKLALSGIDRIHYDVMDGVFVKNIELGFSLLRALKEISQIPIECHLMTIEPEKYIDTLIKYDVEYISFHIESTKRTNYLIDKIKESNRKAGIVKSPDTDINQVLPSIKNLDFMIFMTVEPGFVGQSFKPQALEGIKKIKRVIDDNNYKIELGADGGLSENTIPDVLKSGVKNLILGSSSLFKVKGIYESYKRAVLNVRKIAENCFKE